MSKQTKRYKKELNEIIKELSKRKNTSEKISPHEIFIGIAFVIPLIFTPIAALFFEHSLLVVFITFIICYGLIAIMNIYRNKKEINSFYQIKDAHTKFNIVNVTEEKIIKDLYNNSALTFISEPNNQLLDFIYNWLNNKGVIKSNYINIYLFNGKTLKKVYDYSRFDDEEVFMSIFLNDLSLNETNKKAFGEEHLLVGSRYLDDIVDNDKR